MAIHARFFGGAANWHVEPLADIHRTPPRTLRVEVDGVQLDYTFVRSTTHEQSMGRVDRIQADYRDGVLTLTIPVAEEAKPRKISVSHTNGHTNGHQVIESETAERPSVGA